MFSVLKIRVSRFNRVCGVCGTAWGCLLWRPCGVWFMCGV